MPKKQQQKQNSHIVFHDELIQGSPEWLAAREGKFTGSNALKLLSYGAVPAAMAHNDGWAGNKYTRRGHLLEPEAIELYEKITGVTVGHSGFVTNDKFPDCLYSPDGFLPDRVIEVKCFNPKRHLETAKFPGAEIQAQIQFGMMIMELPSVDLVLYCPKEVPVDQMLIIIPIKANKAIHDNFRRKLEVYYGKRAN